MQAVRTDEGGGLLLVSIEKDTPAAQAGLLLGDVIVAIDGKNLENFDQLLDVLSGESVGKKVSLDVVRAGKQREIAVVIGERPRGRGRREACPGGLFSATRRRGYAPAESRAPARGPGPALAGGGRGPSAPTGQ